jgi:hypothetical protein
MSLDFILQKHTLSKDDLIFLLQTKGKEEQTLFDFSGKIKQQHVGNIVYLRGLIEYSNNCRKNCYYCGIRRSNNLLQRYCLTEDEVLQTVQFAYHHGYGSIAIQSGELSSRTFINQIDRILKESKPIRFEGNSYSEEWKKEAERRGLDCKTSVPLIYDAYTSEDSIKMFESAGVMTKKELEARNEVKWETYTKKIQIEARVLGDLSINHIIPVATRYQSVLLDNICKMKTVFDEKKAAELSKEDLSIIEEIATHIAAIKKNVDDMVEARKVANKIEDAREKAIVYHDNVLSYFDIIRYHVDKLELIVDDQMWPLPKYRELLFTN